MMLSLLRRFPLPDSPKLGPCSCWVLPELPYLPTVSSCQDSLTYWYFSQECWFSEAGLLFNSQHWEYCRCVSQQTFSSKWGKSNSGRLVHKKLSIAQYNWKISWYMASDMIGPRYSNYVCLHLKTFSLSTGINVRKLLPFGCQYGN